MVPSVYGIGNTLIDIVVHVEERDLDALGLHRGTMHLIDEARRAELLSFISGRETTYECGGSAPNTLVSLALFGTEVRLAGMVGRDEYGDIYERRLRELSVPGSLFRCGEPTGSSIILVSPDGERTMNTYLGANRSLGPSEIDTEELRRARYLYFTGYMWDTENQKEAVMKAISHAEDAGLEVVFDLADPFAVSRNREAFHSLIEKHADIVFANSEEARILFDNYDPAECAKSLGRLCRTAVVKDGSRGSYVCYGCGDGRAKRGGHTKGRIDRGAGGIDSGAALVHVPVQPVQALDSTGAGDTYSAGFLLGLLHGKDVEESARIASRLAGRVIRKYGAQLGKADREALGQLF